jgi:hypothetical protein
MRVASFETIGLCRLRSAVEASWDSRTAYLGAFQPGNKALGQCYPTSRVVQWFFPNFEIACGEVDTGSAIEAHFWNIDPVPNPAEHLDLTWQQFAEGSKVLRFKILDRHALNDSPPTVARCQLLLHRVLAKLELAGTTEGIGLDEH